MGLVVPKTAVDIVERMDSSVITRTVVANMVVMLDGRAQLAMKVNVKNSFVRFAKWPPFGK